MRVFVAQFCCSNITGWQTGALLCWCACEVELCYSPADPGEGDRVSLTSAALRYESGCATGQHTDVTS